MIITLTPFRMSFFSDGTDYNGFFNEHGSAVLSATAVNLKQVYSYRLKKNIKISGFM